MNFIGHTFSADGVKPIQDKLSAFMDMPVPHDKRSLKETLGALSYYRVYLLNFSKYAAVLQDLLKRDAPWVWEERHQAAFLKFRELLKNVPTLSFREESAETRGPFYLTTDASQNSISYYLSQEQKGKDGKWREMLSAPNRRRLRGPELNSLCTY